MYSNNDYMGQDLEESKKTTAKGIVLAILFGVLTAIIGAFIYALLDNYVPFIYANILFAMLYGAAIGKAVSFGAKLGHLTSKGTIFGIGAITILVAEYFNWVFWLYVFTEFEEIIFKFGDMYDFVKLINVVGAWQIKGNTITGTILWIVWACEAIVIALGVVGTIQKFHEDNSYCSRCNSWIFNVALSVEVERNNKKKRYIEQALTNGDFSEIDSMEPILNDNIRNHWRLDLKMCDSCENTFFLNLVDVVIKNYSKGRAEVKESFIVNNLPVDRSVYERIETLIRSSRNYEPNNKEDEVASNTTIEVDDINRYID